MDKKRAYKIIITTAIFWLLDFTMHFAGVGESNYYYTIKLANSLLFSFIWFSIYDRKSHIKRLLFSVIFGTWASFFYLISSYSGLVQWFGVQARYIAPPFVISGIFLPAFFWWVFHILAFYLGIEISSKLIKNKK